MSRGSESGGSTRGEAFRVSRQGRRSRRRRSRPLVARLAPEKRLDVLVRAVAAADDSRLAARSCGDGAEREHLEQLARDLGVASCSLGDVEWERIVELYVAADVFALLSEREPWAVVVNEAAACGLPLVLSDRVGAAHDLLRDGENGTLVPAGDVDAAARRSARSRPTRSCAGHRASARASSHATGATGRASRDSSRPFARPSEIEASLLRVADGSERKRILVLNQYYWPGVEATAHLLTELCEALAEDYEVEVVTGVLHGHEDEPRQIEHNGVLDHARRVDLVRALRARPARGELLLVPRSAFRHALSGPRPISCSA